VASDGKVISFLADAANGIVWQLRYRAASASTYKWEFIGGAALYAAVDTLESTTSTTYTTLTTAGPTVTLPTLTTGGDFDVTVGARITLGGSDAAYMSYQVGGTAAIDDDAVLENAGAAAASQGVSKRRKTALSSATALAARYRTATGQTDSFRDRFMEVLPVRVG
jgi:hypothetical protein